MQDRDKLYIDGAWTPSTGSGTIDVVNATTEEVMGRIPEGTAEDVDRAAKAARRAFETWSSTPVEERAKYLQRLHEGLNARMQEIAETVTGEVGMPMVFSQMIQAGLPAMVMGSYVDIVNQFPFEEQIGNSLVVREPLGVVGCITPWNYPLHQIVAKVAPAIGAGCTVVLKPSEVAPLNAFILAEIIDDAGLPPGVFNLVTGTGPVVGEAIAAHPGVDMVSFTGSTRAGRRVSIVAAETIKKVALELGGKSANVVLDDADFGKAVKVGIANTFINGGQTCTAWTRMPIAQEEIFGRVLSILPYSDEDEAVAIANSTIYGLAGAVFSASEDRAVAVARRLRTGQVDVNGGAFNPVAPFGGYKQSGNGRELGRFGLEEFTELKSIQR